MQLLHILLLAALIIACQPESEPAVSEPGAPLPGLTQAEVARFQAGKALFNRVFTEAEGLGPAFNENQCSACHTVPAAGGTTGLEPIVKTTRYPGPGKSDLLQHEGG